MSANPAIALDFNTLNTIDLDAIFGGAAQGQEGWGQWIGKYAGAAALGAGGFAAGHAVAGPIGGHALGAVGAHVGYDYGGRLGNWITGGR